jgi:uroporphyrinogen III methyltransferase / synthase
MGAQVDVIEAYETVVPPAAKEKLESLFASSKPHIVTFTSSSTVSNFLSLLGENAAELLQGVDLASIGPVTSETLRKNGFQPAIEATEYTMPGLVQAIADHVSRIDPAQKRLHRVK